MPGFSQTLLIWYDAQKRTLPWRGTRDPYRIWLSEIMLQQTRAQTVEGYYLRFLERFPDVFRLAAAGEDEVLKCWEGLGYYSRARNLHAAARIVAGEMNGRFPQSAAELRGLPGIGPYAANAIASIAYGECVPALDGNQARILARVLAWPRPLRTPFDLEEPARERMDPQRPGDYNQALMDLGAGVCLPRAPHCGECPLSCGCLAFEDGDPTAWPLKRPPVARRTEARTVLLLEYEGGYVMQKRPGKGLLAGLYQFPNAEGHLDADAVLKLVRGMGAQPEGAPRPLPSARHVFTHLVWEMRGWRVALKSVPEGWSVWRDLEALALPSAFRVYADIARGR